MSDAGELEAGRRVVAMAEHLEKGSNPRFVVTSLSAERWEAWRLYEELYCVRGEMENRIKEQLMLFAGDGAEGLDGAGGRLSLRGIVGEDLGSASADSPAKLKRRVTKVHTATEKYPQAPVCLIPTRSP